MTATKDTSLSALDPPAQKGTRGLTPYTWLVTVYVVKISEEVCGVSFGSCRRDYGKLLKNGRGLPGVKEMLDARKQKVKHRF